MRGKIQKKIDALLSAVIITILLPLFIVIIGQHMQLEELLYGNLQTGAAVVDTADIEQRLVGIVAKEISADAPEEAVLAQCVIARTNLYDAKEKGTAEPEAITTGEMRKLWGEQFEECYQYMEACVACTEGEVLMWKEDYAYAAYHAISAGSTRDMTELYREANMPYLKAQACEADAVAEEYLAVSYMEPEAFAEACNRLFADCGVSDVEEVVIETRDAAGYVTAMKVGEASCDGETFREGMGLKSACFSLAKVDGKVRIVTKGLGHGFGLSQNMAAVMAEEGSSYTEILTYFFPGAELCNVSGRK